MMLTQQELDGVIAFHGHSCPGLAFGIRVGEWAMREFGHAADEEVVAVVESDMCAVDAIQYLVGCTFGKGNFIFLDYGKNAFSFFRRSDTKAARVVARRDLLLDLREQENALASDNAEGRMQIRHQMIDRVLRSDFDAVFSVGPVQIAMPEKARIHKSIRCDACGEMAMATRILCDPKLTGGRNLCIPCRMSGEQS
ncbi:MAG: FmdE family protein [Planctomycetaceae bacterium]|nr:FmdE family protein [Planctomycetaceae bacterium]